jgi:hypothetical protein
MPGIGLEIDGAMQQAAQPGRQVRVIRTCVDTAVVPGGMAACHAI